MRTATDRITVPTDHLARFCVAFSLLLVAASSPLAARAQDLSVPTLVEQYRAFDASRYGGMGWTRYTTAETLGWGESYFLMDYLACYRATGDTTWLTKVTQHFDVLLTTMSDHDGDGYKGWQTTRYSVAYAATVSKKSAAATVVPVETRITNIDRAQAVTGDKYQVTFGTGLVYTLRDLTTAVNLVTNVKLSGTTITGIPGVTLSVTGTPVSGDYFVIQTTAAAPLEYLVHEGMLLYPIAQFIEIANKGRNIPATLKAKADTYLDVILTNFVPKWERYWVEFSGGRGAYTATESPAERNPSQTLPHNQYAMTAQVYLILDATKPNAALRDKAVKMTRFFKSYLAATGRAWTWNYWDNGDGKHSSAEDASHGALEVALAIEALRRGVEFTQAEVERFAYTLIDQMWNGSLTDPVIGGTVNSKGGDTSLFNGRGWVELCAYQPQVWDVCKAVFLEKGSPVALAPTMAWMQASISQTAVTITAVPLTESSIALMTTPDRTPNVWNVVAPCLIPDDKTYLTTLSGFGTTWIAWRWDPTENQWEVPQPFNGRPVTADEFNAGSAWWIAISGSGGETSLPILGLPTPTSQPYTVSLKTGWNLVANPFAFPVAWSDSTIKIRYAGQEVSPSQAQALGWVDSRAIWYDTAQKKLVTRYSVESSPYVMPTCRGQWLYSAVSGAILAIPPIPSAPEGTATPPPPDPPLAAPSLVRAKGDIWALSIALRSSRGDDSVVASVRKGVTPSLMASEIKPPLSPTGNASYVAFISQDGTSGARFSRQTQSPDGEMAWTLEVKGGSEDSLEWNGSLIPEGYAVTLEDLGTGQRVDMRQDSRLPLTGDGVRRLVLRAMPTTTQRPERSFLLRNYPNPFNPETWIPFELSEASDVTIRIFTEGGDLVNTLNLGRREPGRYTDRQVAAYWDGRNAHGETSASGVYVYEIEAGSFRATRRMVLQK